MKNTFSIYDSPLSEETKRIKRNLLIASCVCIFISMTNQLPTTFSLWGAQFDTKQQEIVGWLLFSITLYFYLHFIAVAGIEISKWIQPFYEAVITRNRLIKNPEFDNTD